MWAHWLVAMAGIWLMCAPAALRYAGLPADHDHVVGPIVATFGMIAAFQITRALRWCNVAIGLWLLCAPWILGYHDAIVKWNSVASGVFIAAFSFIRGRLSHRYGGGWRALRG